MRPIDATIASLRREISSCETQLETLKQRLHLAEARAEVPQPTSPTDSPHLATAILGGFPEEWQDETMAALAPHSSQGEGKNNSTSTNGNGENKSTNGNGKSEGNRNSNSNSTSKKRKYPFSPEEYARYGRQLIMPEVGLRGQLRLKSARVLVVGAGGLGCPAAMYLAGAGVGTLGIVDGDTVERSNLHRQVCHSEGRVGWMKVDSAVCFLRELNPLVTYTTHPVRLDPTNAPTIFSSYDLILDCTDTPASRYLISDTCVLLGKPLVSASALRTEGQLTVLNNPPRPPGDPTGGPCYRCVFPKPPPAASVVSCGDGGILGPVVGVMGVLQALEGIKVIAAGVCEQGGECDSPVPGPGLGAGQEAENGATPTPSPSLLLFSATSSPQFRTIRLRSRKPKCAACGPEATVSREALASGSMDYVQFCGSVGAVDVLGVEERVGVEEYARLRAREDGEGGGEAWNGSGDGEGRATKHVLVDVRERVQFELCHLQGSVNLPFSEVVAAHGAPRDGEVEELEWVRTVRELGEGDVVVTCRLGNDSQIVVRRMKEAGLEEGGKRRIVDVRGGLRAWREKVDGEFPEY